MEVTNSQSLIRRIDLAKESPLFFKVFALVTMGLLLDASDVYLASTTNTTIVATKFATAAQGSAFLSAGFLGLFLGSIFAGYMGDRFGRNRIYSINLLVFGCFTILAGFSPNIQALIVFRLLASLGLGAELVTGFSLVNEFAPVAHRGRWAGAASFVANLGSPLGLLLCTLLIPRFTWRSVYFVVGALALILWMIRRHNFPESPRWLISQGKLDQARQLIDKMEINGSYQAKPHSSATKVVHVSLKRGLFVAAFLAGTTTVVQYTFTSWVPTLLVKQGVDIAHSFLFSTIMMIGAPIGALCGAMLVDRIGRKPTIGIGFLLTAILGVTYTMQRTSTMVILIGFLLTVCMYAMNASILSVYVPELFSTKFRFRGSGYANAMGRLLNVIMPFAVVAIISRYNPNFVFYGIATLAILGSLVVTIWGPETKKHPVE